MANDVLQSIIASQQLTNAIPAVNQVLATASGDPNTDSNRRAARSLYHSQVGDLLKHDILDNSQTKELIESLSNSPRTLAIAAKDNPFLSEILYQINNDMRRGKYNKQKREITGSVGKLLGNVRSIEKKDNTVLNNTIRAYGVYKDIAARTSDPIKIARFLREHKISLTILPTSIKKDLRDRILAQQEDAGESMSVMRGRWNTTTKNRNLERLKNNALRTQGKLKQDQTVKEKAISVLGRLRAMRAATPRPIDSGKEINLRPMLTALSRGSSTAAKTANLLDMLSSQQALKRKALKAGAYMAEGKDIKKPTNEQLVAAYLKTMLAGHDTQSVLSGQGVLLDRLESILKGME